MSGKRGAVHGTLAERFWPKVDVRGPNDCWPWMAGRDQDGYGRIGRGGKGSPTVRAHRVSWELANGAIPSDLLILHSCDNPSCVNLAHLSVGTHAENHADRDAKGRGPRGSNNGRAILTEVTVRAVRRARGRVKDICNRHGVTRFQVWAIKSGRRWQHVQ